MTAGPADAFALSVSLPSEFVLLREEHRARLRPHVDDSVLHGLPVLCAVHAEAGGGREVRASLVVTCLSAGPDDLDLDLLHGRAVRRTSQDGWVSRLTLPTGPAVGSVDVVSPFVTGPYGADTNRASRDGAAHQGTSIDRAAHGSATDDGAGGDGAGGDGAGSDGARHDGTGPDIAGSRHEPDPGLLGVVEIELPLPDHGQVVRLTLWTTSPDAVPAYSGVVADIAGRLQLA